VPGKSWLLLIAGITFLAPLEAGSKRAEKPYDVPEAYEVYSALLAQPSAKQKLLIATATVAFDDCLESQGDPSEDSAIADYKKANQTVWQLQPKFKLTRNYKLLSEEEIKALIKPDPKGGFFYSFHGDVSIIHLSAIGFNADKTTAFVEMSSVCGGLCGGGGPFTFQKINGKWRKYEPPSRQNADGTLSFRATCRWNY
jgi:hypothetical protein